MTQAFPALAPDADRLALRIRQMIASGRVAAARPMLRVLRGLDGEPAVLAELEARLMICEGAFEAAITVLTGAIDDMPGTAGLHACRAEALIRVDRPHDATIDAAEAVLLAPGAVDARALLGVVLIEAGRNAEAATCLADATAMEPANPNYRLALAEALDRLGRAGDAALVLEDGIALAPADLALRRAATLLRVQQRDFAGAVASGEAARRAGIMDAALFGLIGHASTSLGDTDAAAEAYGEALKLAPDDAYVRHLVAAHGSVAAEDRAPADYVRVVFDGYAERFEAHLLSLGYRVPGLIRAALERLPGCAGPVTDVGCGTGLLAVTCDDLAGPWTGVDLSTRMIALARDKQLYETLVAGDIAAVLPSLPSAGLILAGDVLCYFGKLEDVLGSFHAHLRPGGSAILSLEAAEDGAPHAIRPNGRYAHSEAYMLEAASQAGFAVLSVDHEVLRFEQDAPVPGMIVSLRAD